jgi:dihydropteroate synthase
MLDLATLAALHGRHREEAGLTVADFALGRHRFDFSQAKYLMGVINLSPDSWYRESVALSAEAAVRRGRILHAQGAAIVDLGAESTLPHAAIVEPADQIARITPIVRELTRAGICVSVETYDAQVATAALQAGAAIINLTGSRDATPIYHAVAEAEAGLILCFVQGPHVRDVGELKLDDDPIPMLEDYFAREVEAATSAGVSRLWLDPGLGFYYRNLQDSDLRVRHQLRVFLNSFRLRRLGWPVCQALPHAFACFEDEVRSAEPFFAVPALLGGADLLRTHEVAKVRGVLRTLELIREAGDVMPG